MKKLTHDTAMLSTPCKVFAKRLEFLSATSHTTSVSPARMRIAQAMRLLRASGARSATYFLKVRTPNSSSRMTSAIIGSAPFMTAGVAAVQPWTYPRRTIQ